MGEAIITRRGGSGEVIVEFENFTPSNTVEMYHPDGELARSTLTLLSAGRSYLAGASVGNYALFAGGDFMDIVDAYDASLARSTPTALSAARDYLAGASVGDYALFAGGYGYSGYMNGVDAYDASLVHSTPTGLSVGRQYLAGASVGNYALFAGGEYSWGCQTDVVDAYDTSLVRSTPIGLSVGRSDLAGASVGNYALFAGGYYFAEGSGYNDVDVVDAYDASLVRSTPTGLSVEGDDCAGASGSNYALFAGGYDGNYTNVNAYDTSLVRFTPTALSVARNCLAGASVGDYALFAGGCGYDIGSSVNATVDAYDASLVHSTPTGLSVARADLAGASVGNYTLFAGGWNDADTQNVVDVYTLQVSVAILYAPIGAKYKFGESEETATTNEITVRVPVTGYIKFKNGVIRNG